MSIRPFVHLGLCAQKTLWYQQTAAALQGFTAQTAHSRATHSATIRRLGHIHAAQAHTVSAGWAMMRFGAMIICTLKTAQRASIVNWRQRHLKVLACARGDFCALLVLLCRSQRPRALLLSSRVPCSRHHACQGFMHRLLSPPCAIRAHQAHSVHKMALPWRRSVRLERSGAFWTWTACRAAHAHKGAGARTGNCGQRRSVPFARREQCVRWMA